MPDRNMIFPSLTSDEDSNKIRNFPVKICRGTKRTRAMAITPSGARDPMIKEETSRRKLNRMFVALSAIVPGLKKMDKASILEDAIRYVKDLQERASFLEDQTKNIPSSADEHEGDSGTSACSYEDISDGCCPKEEEGLPEIEAKVSDKNVLIRIHCQKQYKGFAVKVMGEIERLHLAIVSCSVLPFGDYFLDITVVAQMGDDFHMTVKDLIRNLQLAFF